MTYLLDTDTCIHVIRKKPPALLNRLRAHPPGRLALSAITVAELRFGAEKSRFARMNHEAIDLFLAPFELPAFDVRAAQVYGRIRAELERKGTPIGPHDLLIAAHALSISAVLVTNNVREFRQVPGLRHESWA
ncbi:MAG: type II toxin-antitoxin system VapC family toxin [Planctomycetota bacterium]|nr:type II toxin-antitoxin system VapC family toxin [Planctomycetota bacterium]